tara:strand:+ start:413 stop:640 length:228 start_codon:yes stop_codon:yes gene_type:complete
MRTSLNAHQKIPKVREYAELSLIDGTVLSGYVFVEATARIQDLLNDSAPFMPFIDANETVHLVNKQAIVRIQPFD